MYGTVTGCGLYDVLGAAYVSLCKLLFTACCAGSEYRWIYLTWHVMLCVNLTVMAIFSTDCLCNQWCTAHHCIQIEFTWILSTWHAILCVKLCKLRWMSRLAMPRPYYISKYVYIIGSGTILDELWRINHVIWWRFGLAIQFLLLRVRTVGKKVNFDVTDRLERKAGVKTLPWQEL